MSFNYIEKINYHKTRRQINIMGAYNGSNILENGDNNS